MAKFKKALKKVGKAAAIAGAAYAASKMGKTRDSEVGAKLAKKVSPIGSTYDMAGAGGVPKKGMFGRIKDFMSEEVFTTNPKTKAFPPMPSSYQSTYTPGEGQVDDILSRGMSGAKKGMYVTVKTKMGRNKKTRIC